MNIKTISSSSLFAMTLLLTGCDSDGSKAEVVSNEEEYSYQVEEKKKGAVFSNNDLIWSNQIAELKAHWNYDWSLVESSKYQPGDIEFVPMVSGGTLLTQEELDALSAAHLEGKIQYILGFNEPDNENKANITVAEALPTWDQLVSLNIPLVSPATITPLSRPIEDGDAPEVKARKTWMDDFMTERGDTVDYVAMHWYGAPDAEAFLAKVDEVYNTYGKPVWITEFAVADWEASLAVEAVIDDPATLDVDETAAAIPAVENRYSEQEVIDFMKVVLPALDENDNVFRYSWFSVSPDADDYHNLASSALFGARNMESGDTTMTDLGSVYRENTRNALAGFGLTPVLVDLVEGNLVVNGHFENGDQDWGTWFSSIEEEAVDGFASDGTRFGRINNKFNGQGSLVHDLQTPLEAGRTYKLSYQAQWSEGGAGQVFKIVVQDQLDKEKKVLNEDLQTTVEGAWSLNEHTFTVAEDGSYKIVFYHWKKYIGFFYLDEVVLLDITE